jgi:ribonuclease Z
VWCWYRPDNLLIDAGDGCSLDLADHHALDQPKRVLLTHGHGDHLWGLMPLLLNRSMPSLEQGAALAIFYPAGSVQIEAAIALATRLYPAIVEHGVTFTALAAGDSIPLKGRRRVVTFPTAHIPGEMTLGYAVAESRTKLRDAYAGAADDTIRDARAALGEEAVLVRRDHPLFIHTGDTMPITTPLFRDAEWLVYDCTFLDAADRDAPTHATLDEVLASADATPPQRLVLHHLSRRYDRKTITDTLRARVTAHAPSYAVWLWDDLDWTFLYSPDPQ